MSDNYDACVPLRVGEIAPVYGDVGALAGTAQIQGAPAPTFQVLNVDRTPVAGWETPRACTGYDASAGSDVRAWYNVNASGLKARWYYVGEFVVWAVGSDGITREYTPRLLLRT